MSSFSTVNELPNKTVAQKTYLHVNYIDGLETIWKSRVLMAENLTRVQRCKQYNVIRYDVASNRINLLNYPDFFDEPFPVLKESWGVDLATGEFSYRTYEYSLNPPILHRKELLLPISHPQYAKFKALTKAAESVGLFDEPSRIGYQRQWFHLIKEKGYMVVGHDLVPLGNDETLEGGAVEHHSDWLAARQLTALVRYSFSAPIQSLARYGFLDGHFTIFDYGCGRGDDVRGLVENELQAAGWDPYYAPENIITEADIVNLGFVINVIENFDERVDTLIRAYSLAKQLLVVSVMLVNENSVQGERFQDGLLTKRGTFQKYYTQAEIKAFLAQAVHDEPIPVAPGVFYIFKDKDIEQQFLIERYRSRRNLPRSTLSVIRKRGIDRRHDREIEKYASYKAPLERLWSHWVALGRRPDKSEIEDIVTLTEGFGSLAKALRFIERRKDIGELGRSRKTREADLCVYFALNQFVSRKPYKHLECKLQRDIKEFFGSYSNAQESARDLLFQIANVEVIQLACEQAAMHGLGYLENESLQLHVSLVEQLPPVLRVYIGCAAVLYGDYHNADLVKIHIRSGKITLMKYDDFEGRALPRMVERVKIKLREQDIEYYVYGDEYDPPYLYQKSRYINEEFPNYPEQVDFDKEIVGLGIFDFSQFGPSPCEFHEMLAKHRWTIEKSSLVRSRNAPDIDDLCGRYLTFRYLIECGETQVRTGLPNLPKQIETYNALHDLAVNILDPVIDYFGMIRITYGFSSPALSREVPGSIDPKRDQHAAHELNRRGKPVCDRLGAAVDFIVDDESMLEVAQWIAGNTSFDRLYFYGDDKPLHVSYGPSQSRQIVRMIRVSSGRLVPRVTTVESFMSET